MKESSQGNFIYIAPIQAKSYLMTLGKVNMVVVQNHSTFVYCFLMIVKALRATYLTKLDSNLDFQNFWN